MFVGRNALPLQTRVQARVLRQADSLLELCDSTGDAAAQRSRAFDWTVSVCNFVYRRQPGRGDPT